MKTIYKIKLTNGETVFCDYQNEEIMHADIESKGLEVIEYWWE